MSISDFSTTKAPPTYVSYSKELDKNMRIPTIRPHHKEDANDIMQALDAHSMPPKKIHGTRNEESKPQTTKIVIQQKSFLPALLSGVVGGAASGGAASYLFFDQFKKNAPIVIEKVAETANPFANKLDYDGISRIIAASSTVILTLLGTAGAISYLHKESPEMLKARISMYKKDSDDV